MKYPSIFAIFISLLILAFAACGDDPSAENDHDHHDDELFRLTRWVDDAEFFALFEIHENSGRIEGDLFISLNNVPASDASATLSFRENGTDVTEQQLEARQPGVFPFELFFQDEDEVELALNAIIDGHQYEMVLGSVYRYAGHPEAPDVENLHQLDKQMQWRMSISSAFAEVHEIPEVITGLGRVQPDPSNFYEISSPVDGHIDAEFFAVVPSPGASVQEGERLVAISPPLASESSWIEFRLAYIQAEAAYNRARRLFENDAISLREYQVREREYEVRKAGYEHFLEGVNHGAHIEDAGPLLYLNAYKPGVIADSYVVSGRPVKQGDPLFTIYDPSRLWLEVLGSRDDLSALPDITGVELLIGRDERLTLGEEETSFVSRDLRSDATGRRSKLILSVENPDQLLALHQPVRVRLMGSDSEEFVAVPGEALFDEDSHKVVFVVHSGDQFERRIVQTGRSYGGLTAIIDGLDADERIVIQGVYPLHLLTGDLQIDDGHDH